VAASQVPTRLCKWKGLVLSRHENAVMIMHRPPCYAKKLRTEWTQEQPGRETLPRIVARCIFPPSPPCFSFSPGNALLHNVPAPHEHLSMPITDFGKGARRVSPSSSRSHRLRAKPVPRRCHRGHARWKLARISHCSLPYGRTEAAANRAAWLGFYCRESLSSAALVGNLASNCLRYFMAIAVVL